MFLRIVCLVAVLANINYRVHTTLPSASDGLKTIIDFWFPEDAEFNESCVSEGCPALKNFSLCLNEINITVLHSILSTATVCMKKPICGIDINNRSTESLTMTVNEWLPGMEIDGNVTTLAGTGHLTTVSNNQFEHFLNHHLTHPLPLQMTMLIMNIRAFGHIQLDLSFRSMLPSILGQALSVTIPDAIYDVKLDFISTMLLNQSLTGSNIEIELLHPIIKAHPTLCGLDMPEGFPSILTLFSSMCEVMIEKSSWAVRKAGFLKRYFQTAIRSIPNVC